VAAGVVGSVGREESIGATDDLLRRDVSPTLGFAFLIASRNMTIHFWAIFALSLGAEFATGQILGALVMIGIVTVSLYCLKLKALEAPSREKSQGVESVEHPGSVSWRAVLLSTDGWLAVFKFVGQEVRRFAPSLAVGILLEGIILAAGLRRWWIVFADVFGLATLSSDLINALAGAVLGVAASLSPVGNLPVVHALFKSDGLGYPGIIGFCLACAIHPRDIRTYVRIFGRRQALALVGLLFGPAVSGGLGFTWIYAALGFRPSLPPVRLAGSLFRSLLGALGF
jgi:uncharacterized membrane protein YraQ (UPF0718 family)